MIRQKRRRGRPAARRDPGRAARCSVARPRTPSLPCGYAGPPQHATRPSLLPHSRQSNLRSPERHRSTTIPTNRPVRYYRQLSHTEQSMLKASRPARPLTNPQVTHTRPPTRSVLTIGQLQVRSVPRTEQPAGQRPRTAHQKRAGTTTGFRSSRTGTAPTTICPMARTAT